MAIVETKNKSDVINKFMKLNPASNALITSIMVIFAAISLLPLLLVVMISFSTTESIAVKGYSWFPLGVTFEAYRTLLYTGRQVWQSYLVNIAYTSVGTILSLFVMSMFAYCLVQRRFTTRRFWLLYVFFTMLFSGGLVPTFMVNVSVLRLYDTFWILFLPGLVSAYNLIILRTFVRTSIPDSLYESAFIDGANDFRIYCQIVLPLMKPGLATVGLFGIVARWNNWFTGLLYIENPRLVPLQTMLTRIQNSVEFIRQNAGDPSMPMTPELQAEIEAMPSESLRMAIAVISVIPILFAYPFFQKYFITGLTIGSVKE